MKLALFSDIHLGIDEADHDRIAWLLRDARRWGAEHVVIAGDVLDHGNLGDLRRFKANLRDIGFWHPERLTVVPGNHDIIGTTLLEAREAASRLVEPGSLIEKMTGAWELLTSAFDELVVAATDTTSRRAARRRRFVRAFEELMVGARRGRRGAFAHAKQLPGVELVAIDTTTPRCMARGEVAPEELESLDRLLKAARRRRATPIVVGHHRPIDVPSSELPTWYRVLDVLGEDMNLANREDLLGVMRERGCDVILCGHWHVLGDEEYDDEDSGVRVITQGRSGGMDQDAGEMAYSYDRITIQGASSPRRTTRAVLLEDIDARLARGK